jgi:hypothetical protein
VSDPIGDTIKPIPPTPCMSDADLDAMDLDALDRYHDSLLSCIELADSFNYDPAPYRQEAERVTARLKAAGWKV